MNNTETKEEQKNNLLTATVIHDLKTPLIAQIRSMELLRKGYWGELNKAQDDILDVIIESSNFLKEMLYSLLDVLKFENGLGQINPQEFNLNELILLCINEYKTLAAAKNIKIIFNSANDSHLLTADKNLIRRVIMNLTDNSIKYGLNDSDVIISTEEKADFLIMKFKNTGFEITQETKAHIFEKFVSGNNFKQNPGTGLGLYYCKKAIEAHNGEIELISKGNSNEFIVKLPKEYISKSYLNFV